MVELTSTSASNGTRNWYLYWYRCISSVDVFISGAWAGEGAAGVDVLVLVLMSASLLTPGKSS
jgi:hypothetical protein